jgi:hypothetical protein
MDGPIGLMNSTEHIFSEMCSKIIDKFNESEMNKCSNPVNRKYLIFVSRCSCYFLFLKLNNLFAFTQCTTD